MEDEFNQFIEKVSDFVNQEISQFRQRLTLLEGSSQQIQSTEAQVREIAQAMIEKVDKVEHLLESTRLYQKEETKTIVGQWIFELKMQILQKVDKDMTELETKLMVK